MKSDLKVICLPRGLCNHFMKKQMSSKEEIDTVRNSKSSSKYAFDGQKKLPQNQTV